MTNQNAVGGPVMTAEASPEMPEGKKKSATAEDGDTGAFDVVGDRRCCAWRAGPGAVRIQVRDGDLADALDEIKGGQCVAYSVGGGYLKVFEFEQPLSWARRWVTVEAALCGAKPKRRRNGGAKCRKPARASGLAEDGPRK